jgi:DNA-binding CsgD family transcriptional regulator/tetratricopeptide (TPR) repeat protein
MTGMPSYGAIGAGRGNRPAEGRIIRGRELEQQAILSLVQRARRGHGGALLIEGEPGTGKSLLLAQAASAAETEGVCVAVAVADELSRFMPLGPLLLATRESPATLADEAGMRRVADQPTWLVDILRARLEKRASAGPLLVSLDDLHWADPVTLYALRALPWQLASYPVSWILVRRTPGRENDAGLLFDLLESEGAARISLKPLVDDAVADLIADALGAIPDPNLLALAAGAAGNPLMLAELVSGLLDENAVVISGGHASVASAHVPRRIRVVVRGMLDRLSTGTRQLLETASVLGRSFRLEDAAAMLGTSPAALLPGVEEALSTRILVATQDALAFRLDLVWQAVSAALPPPVKQALHRQFGEILLERGGSAAAAAHLLDAARGGDGAALAGLDRAAAEVLSSSPDIAADLASRALELTGLGAPELLPRSVAAAEALTAAGRLDEATVLARSVLAAPLPAITSAQLRCTLSLALTLGGQAVEGLAHAERVLAEPRLSDELRAGARIALLQALTARRDNRRAGELAAAILAVPGEEHSDVVIGALVVLAAISWDAGRLGEALDLSAEAVSNAAWESPDARHFHPHLFLASRLVDLRRFDEARAAMRAADDHMDALGAAGWSASPATLRARMALASGQLDDATAEATAAFRVATTLQADLHSPAPLAILATVALRRGDLHAAARHIQSLATLPARFGAAHADTWDTVVAAQVEEARNGPRAALDILAEFYAELREHRFALLCDPTCAPWLVRSALAAGDRDRAELAATVADEISRGNPGLPAVTVSAAHAGGILDQDPERLEQAADQHADRWARASAAEDLGAYLAVTGSRRDAIGRLDQALGDYDGTGAARDVARARRRLRRLGVRRGHWAATSKPVSGWGSLTGTERTASELVSHGYTNQEVADQMFISVHTVAFHLRQVFRKLGISSRVELARIAVEQAQGPETYVRLEPDHPA